MNTYLNKKRKSIHNEIFLQYYRNNFDAFDFSSFVELGHKDKHI